MADEAVENWETGGDEIGRGVDEARERLAAEERRKAERLVKAAAQLRLAADADAAAADESDPFGGRQVKIMRRPESSASLAKEAKEQPPQGQLPQSASASSLPLEERERRYAEARMRIFGAAEAAAEAAASSPPCLSSDDISPSLDEGATPKALEELNQGAASKKKKKKKKGKGEGSPEVAASLSPTPPPPQPPPVVTTSASTPSSASGTSPPARTRIARRPAEPDTPPDFVRSRPLPGQPTYQGRPLLRPLPPSVLVPSVPAAPQAPLPRMRTVDLTKGRRGNVNKSGRGAAGFAANAGVGRGTNDGYSTYGAPPSLLKQSVPVSSAPSTQPQQPPRPLLSLPFPPELPPAATSKGVQPTMPLPMPQQQPPPTAASYLVGQSGVYSLSSQALNAAAASTVAAGHRMPPGVRTLGPYPMPAGEAHATVSGVYTAFPHSTLPSAYPAHYPAVSASSAYHHYQQPPFQPPFP